MNAPSCEMTTGQLLHADHPEWPLFHATIHGGERERIKLSKRLTCGLRHLPLRLAITYETDPERSMAAGVGADPTLMVDGEIVAEGLMATEQFTARFEALLRSEG